MVLCTAALLDQLLPTVDLSSSSSQRSSCRDNNSTKSSSNSSQSSEEQTQYTTTNSHMIYPHISGGMYDLWSLAQRLRPEYFPSQDAQNIIDNLTNHSTTQNTSRTDDQKYHHRYSNDIRLNLAIHLGDFQEVFSRQHQESKYDGVVTCFFLDTADHILEYILVIKHVLRHGGIWINAGPLHYHRPLAIPYSHEQIIALVSGLGFTVVDSAEVEAMYATEKYVNMKPDFYHIPVTVFRLEKGVTSSSSSSSMESDCSSGIGVTVSETNNLNNANDRSGDDSGKLNNWRGVNFVLN